MSIQIQQKWAGEICDKNGDKYKEEEFLNINEELGRKGFWQNKDQVEEKQAHDSNDNGIRSSCHYPTNDHTSNPNISGISMKVVDAVFRVPLPHSMTMTMFISYVVYLHLNKKESYVDTDLYVLKGRAYFSKEAAAENNMSFGLLGSLLYPLVFFDWFVHYITPTTLLTLYLSKQLRFYVWVPRPGPFAAIFAGAIIVLQEGRADIAVYDSTWFNIASVAIGSVGISLIFSLLSHYVPYFRQRMKGTCRTNSQLKLNFPSSIPFLLNENIYLFFVITWI